MAAPVYAQQPVQMTQVLGEVPKQKSRSLGSQKTKMSQTDVDTYLLIYGSISVLYIFGIYHIYIMIRYHFSDIKSELF